MKILSLVTALIIFLAGCSKSKEEIVPSKQVISSTTPGLGLGFPRYSSFVESQEGTIIPTPANYNFKMAGEWNYANAFLFEYENKNGKTEIAEVYFFHNYDAGKLAQSDCENAWNSDATTTLPAGCYGPGSECGTTMDESDEQVIVCCD